MTRPAPPSLYDDDFYAWTQEQAAALRLLPAGPHDHVDIEHVAEEIEDLGKRDLREVTSFLRRLFEHLLKIGAVTMSRDEPHWRSEARQFQLAVLDAYAPSMRQLIELDRIWQAGLKTARRDLDDVGTSLSAPAACPLTLDELLADDFDIEAAVAKIAAAR